MNIFLNLNSHDKVTEEAVNAGIKEWNEKYKGMFFFDAHVGIRLH